MFHFYMNFILFVHTGHGNFNFNRFSISSEYSQNILFSFEKGSSRSKSLLISFSRLSEIPQQIFHPLSNMGEPPYPLHYLKIPALFFCPLFSKEHFDPIRSTKWWTNNVDFQPKTFIIVLNATTSYIFTDPLGLYLSPEYLLHFLSNLYIPPPLGRNFWTAGAQITGKWICVENSEL